MDTSLLCTEHVAERATYQTCPNSFRHLQSVQCRGGGSCSDISNKLNREWSALESWTQDKRESNLPRVPTPLS